MADHLGRYNSAFHAMQTGVALAQREQGGEDDKHLRVGINNSLVTHAALVRLLIAAGVLTEEQYFEAIADEMEAEVLRYEITLRARGIISDSVRLG